MAHPSVVPPNIDRSAKAVALFLVHSNVLISLSATSIAVVTMVLLNLPIDPLALFIVFAATMFVYSVNKLTDLAEDERNVPGRASFTRRYGRTMLVVGFSLYLAAVGIAVSVGVPGARYLVVPLVVVVAYVRLKGVFLIKNLTVGLAWGTIPLGVGVYYGVLESVELGFLFVYVTAMLTIAAIVFDIKDITGDRAADIRTVPVVFTPKLTRIATGIGNGGIALLVLGSVLFELVPATFLVLLVYNAYVGCYIPFATRDRTPLFYGFVVDGEQIALGCCTLVLEAFVW